MATNSICKIDGCGKPQLAREWCRAHYERWRKYGDPNKRFRPANGDAARYLREVVFPFEGEGCLTWPFHRTKGYGILGWHGRPLIVSRIVCEYVHGVPPTTKHQAAHNCGKGHEGCVNPKHLRWATRSENELDKRTHGTQTTNAKLTEQQVDEIRSLKGIMPQADLAARYGVTRSNICKIQRGKSWACR